MKKIILFGASGNIGQQTLEIIKSQPKLFTLKAFSVGDNHKRIEEIIVEFPTVEMVYSTKSVGLLAEKYPRIKFINEDVSELLQVKTDIVINALSGFFGLQVTLAAIERDLIILNANKESFVVGGALINEKLQSHQAKIYPIDSEHCAIWQCLEGEQNFSTIYLTASGGPFLDMTLEETKSVTVLQALTHPNWNMGKKITVDSATMFNKAFEILEAYHLFHPKKIETLVHPQSIIHSMVMFVDGSIKAQLSSPDMHQVINYFLNYPNRTKLVDQKNLDFTNLMNLTLQKIDEQRFEPIKMAYACLSQNNSRAIAMNAANEVCVGAFLRGEIKYYQITKIVSFLFWKCPDKKIKTYEEIKRFDAEIRAAANRKIREGRA